MIALSLPNTAFSKNNQRCPPQLIACQVPVPDWHLRIPDPTLADAILDRLDHNAYRIQLEGESQRKLRAQRSMSNT